MLNIAHTSRNDVMRFDRNGSGACESLTTTSGKERRRRPRSVCFISSSAGNSVLKTRGVRESKSRNRPRPRKFRFLEIIIIIMTIVLLISRNGHGAIKLLSGFLCFDNVKTEKAAGGVGGR